MTVTVQLNFSDDTPQRDKLGFVMSAIGMPGYRVRWDMSSVYLAASDSLIDWPTPDQEVSIVAASSMVRLTLVKG